MSENRSKPPRCEQIPLFGEGSVSRIKERSEVIESIRRDIQRYQPPITQGELITQDEIATRSRSGAPGFGFSLALLSAAGRAGPESCDLGAMYHSTGDRFEVGVFYDEGLVWVGCNGSFVWYDIGVHRMELFKGVGVWDVIELASKVGAMTCPMYPL